MKNSPKKYILYLSSNSIWGGSEILWAASAKKFSESNYKIRAGVGYDFKYLEKFIKKEHYIDLRKQKKRPSLGKRISRKLFKGTYKSETVLRKLFKEKKPDLVIISQGNNSDGRRFMEECAENNIPFITITHLVTESLWPALDDQLINDLRKIYKLAEKNYFVSKSTMNLHSKLLGQSFSNSELVFNPVYRKFPSNPTYPSPIDGIYKIALVGRVELFHKGYDLLIDVLKNEKWRVRPVQFTLYGDGPHMQLLKRLIKFNHILNFKLNGHNDNIYSIWEDNQILLMPSRMEGQSLTLIEAMRFSRAAIVTDVGGAGELVDDLFCGFIAAHPTLEDLDDALERAWYKRAEWRQMGINAGIAISKKHPADAIAYFNQQVEKIIRQ